MAVLLTFLKRDGTEVRHQVAVRQRETIDIEGIPGLEDAEFSITVESDYPVVVDRTVRWDASGYGGHAETGLAAPAKVWYLAEGATHSGFDLFYLLQNPGEHPVDVRVRYLRPNDAPLAKTYRLAPRSRTNIWVNHEEFPEGSGNRALSSTDVSAVLEALGTTGFLVERAMYLSKPGRPFDAGHASAGLTGAGTTWFLAEGATGDFFDEFILVANPGDVPADLRLTYLLPGGRTYARALTVPPSSRHTIWVDNERFDGIAGLPLAATDVSARIESLNGVPVIVERAMWWPGGPGQWHEAHNTAAVQTAAGAWMVAEGESAGTWLRPSQVGAGVETYVLIANTSPVGGTVGVTLQYETDLTGLPCPFNRIFAPSCADYKEYTLAPSSRTTVAPAQEFPASAGRRYSVLVLSGGWQPLQLVVERAMSWNQSSGAGGQLGPQWAAGTAALGTRVTSCMNGCRTDWDCGGIPAGECGWGGGLCGDYIHYCGEVPSHVPGETCRQCMRGVYCPCYQ